MASSVRPVEPRVLFVHNRKGGVSKVVREHYLRSDVSCGCRQCVLCPSESIPPCLDVNASHYIIPDAAVATHFVELLEHDRLRNVILLQSVLRRVGEHSRRCASRVRDLTSDATKGVFVFANDHCEGAYVSRRRGEAVHVWETRASLSAIQWYKQHLRRTCPSMPLPTFVLLSQNDDVRALAHVARVKSLPVAKYICTFHSDSSSMKDLMTLYESLNQVYEDHLSVQLDAAEVKDGPPDKRHRLTSFEPHLSDEAVAIGVADHSLYRGKLRVGRQLSEAFVSVDVARLSADVAAVHGDTAEAQTFGNIFISNHVMRNRAIHGDVVAIRLLPPPQWKRPNNSFVPLGGSDEDLEEAHVEDSNMSTLTDIPCIPTGVVCAVLEGNRRPFVVTLQQPVPSEPGWVLSVPLDRRIPKIRLRLSAPKTLENDRLVVCIDDWPISSMYPNGHFVRRLGPLDALETNVQSLLVEYGIRHPPFTDTMVQSLPSPSGETEWAPSQEELRLRRDLRTSHHIFSIDPEGCEDIDDALSIRKLDNGNLEIGVHIADVTYFVPQHTLLDREALFRSTSVYLSDRRLNMLPNVLSDNLCSLRSNRDRYAVSGLWEVEIKSRVCAPDSCSAHTFDKGTGEGEVEVRIVDEWFGRTVIHSAREMSYEEAHRLRWNIMSLDEQQRRYGPQVRRVQQDVTLLMNTAALLWRQRMNDGALELASSELRFTFDGNQRDSPKEIIASKPMAIKQTVAEFMIFANKQVARFLYHKFPSSALLRNHPAPKAIDFESVVSAAAVKGLQVDTSSNKGLQESLNRAQGSGDDTFNRILRTMATSAMAEAQYLCTGATSVRDFVHYGLAAPFYTHFTSPIRRYADVVVHRQLLAAVGETRLSRVSGRHSREHGALDTFASPFACSEVVRIASHINMKHRAAKDVSRECSLLFACMYFNGHPDNVHHGVIYKFRRNAMVVFLPAFGLNGNVYVCDVHGVCTTTAEVLATVAPRVTRVNAWKWCEREPDSVRATFATDVGDVHVRLFDRVRVRVGVRHSRSHLPQLSFELVDVIGGGADTDVGFEVDRIDVSSAVQQQEMEQAELKHVLDAAAEARMDPELSMYLQTPAGQGVYNLFDAFHQLTLEQRHV